MASFTLDIRFPDGTSQTRTFSAAETRIGRDSGEICLGDPGVSSRHAKVEFDGTKVVYVDIGSTNGSFDRNGVRLAAPLPLQVGDEVLLGACALRLRHLEAVVQDNGQPSGPRGTMVMNFARPLVPQRPAAPPPGAAPAASWTPPNSAASPKTPPVGPGWAPQPTSPGSSAASAPAQSPPAAGWSAPAQSTPPSSAGWPPSSNEAKASGWSAPVGQPSAPVSAGSWPQPTAPVGLSSGQPPGQPSGSAAAGGWPNATPPGQPPAAGWSNPPGPGHSPAASGQGGHPYPSSAASAAPSTPWSAPANPHNQQPMQGASPSGPGWPPPSSPYPGASPAAQPAAPTPWTPAGPAGIHSPPAAPGPAFIQPQGGYAGEAPPGAGWQQAPATGGAPAQWQGSAAALSVNQSGFEVRDTAVADLQAGIRAALPHWKRLAVAAGLVSVPVGVVAALVGSLAALIHPALALLVTPLSLINAIAVPVAAAAVQLVATAAHLGRSLEPLAAWKLAFARIGQLWPTFFVAGLIAGIGTFFFVIPGILLGAFMVPIIVIEGKRFVDVNMRSLDLVKRNLLYVLVVALLGAILATVVMLPGIVLAALAVVLPPFLSGLLSQLYLAVISPVVSGIGVYYLTGVYLAWRRRENPPQLDQDLANVHAWLDSAR